MNAPICEILRLAAYKAQLRTGRRPDRFLVGPNVFWQVAEESAAFRLPATVHEPMTEEKLRGAPSLIYGIALIVAPGTGSGWEVKLAIDEEAGDVAEELAKISDETTAEIRHALWHRGG